MFLRGDQELMLPRSNLRLRQTTLFNDHAEFRYGRVGAQVGEKSR